MKKLLNFFKYFLLFALSMFLMWFALKGIDFQLVLKQLKNANYLWIIISLIIAASGYFSRAHRWKMQLDPTGHKAGFWAVYNAMMVGYLANLVLPRAGEVVRCSVLKKTDSIPVKVSLGTVITERVLDLVILLSCIALTFFVEFDKLHTFFIGFFNDKYQTLEQNSFLIYSILGIMLLLTLIGVVLIIIYINKLRQNAYFMKLVTFVRGVLDGVFSIVKLKNKGEFIFHTLYVWFTYFIMGYIAFFCFAGYFRSRFKCGFGGIRDRRFGNGCSCAGWDRYLSFNGAIYTLSLRPFKRIRNGLCIISAYNPNLAGSSNGRC